MQWHCPFIMLIMQLMQIRSFVCLPPMRTCQAMARCAKQHNSAGRAAVSDCSAAGPHEPRVSQVFPGENFTLPP